MIAKHTVQCVNKVAGYLNSLAEDKARSALAKCCGAQRWVDELLAARPFTSDAALLAHAERAWWALGREDWLEAFQDHPRIGERTAEEWSRREQAGVDTAAAATRAARAPPASPSRWHCRRATAGPSSQPPRPTPAAGFLTCAGSRFARRPPALTV